VRVVDLHGVRHKDVYGILEELFVADDIPFVVITGKSETMKNVVKAIATTFGLHTHEKLGNSGRLIVCECR